MKSTQEIIADGLGERGVPILLIGGMALPAFDVIRQTVDTDCLMATSKETALQDVLIAAGYIEVQRTYNFVRYTSVSVYHSDVDVLLVDDNTFEKVFVDSTPFKVGNATINVPSAENMIMLKLHAMKNNHKRELKDLSDIIDMIRNDPSRIKDKELQKMCDQYGPDGIYEKIKGAL